MPSSSSAYIHLKPSVLNTNLEHTFLALKPAEKTITENWTKLYGFYIRPPVPEKSAWRKTQMLRKSKIWNFEIFSAKYLCAKSEKCWKGFKLDEHKGAQFKKGIK